MNYILTKLINGNVEIKNLINGDISILLPNKNIMLYRTSTVYSQERILFKITDDANYKLRTLGVTLPYDEIDYLNCVPPITSGTPEGVLQELGTFFFFSNGVGGSYYTTTQIDTMLAILQGIADEFVYEVEVFADLATVSPPPTIGDLAKVDTASGAVFFGIGTRYPSGIYKWTGTEWLLEGDYYQIINKLQEIATNYATITQLNTKLDSGGFIGTGQDLQNSILNLYQITKEKWETINNNLKSYPYTITYVGNNISVITYSTGLGSIIKTHNYTGNKLTSVVLSGAIPIDIPTTKTFTYTGNNITSVTYS